MFDHLSPIRKFILCVIVASFWFVVPTSVLFGFLYMFLEGTFTVTISIWFRVLAFLWLLFCIFYTYKAFKEEEQGYHPSLIKPYVPEQQKEGIKK